MRKVKILKYFHKTFRYAVQIRDGFGLYFRTESITSGRIEYNWDQFNRLKRGLK